MSDVECLVRPDYKKLSNNFTDVVAFKLHYFEWTDTVRITDATAAELNEAVEAYIYRYRNDPKFHARVDSIVSCLMQAVQKERDECIAAIGGDTGAFKIVPA